MSADVRQLLRAERAARRITHPHASYTTEGKLLCNLCETPVKSEAQWQSHLHSTGHVLRSQRAKEASDLRSTGKKRKAESPEPEPKREDDRKRARPAADEEDDEGITTENGVEEEMLSDAEIDVLSKIGQKNLPVRQEQVQQQDISDSELLAFERELAELEATTNQNSAMSALNSSATISAAPMSAEELAAKAREEQSTQREKRDEEMEAEKEDAARALEDELEEMERLDDRVKRLKERREALRKLSSAGDGGGDQEAEGGGDVNGVAAEQGEDEAEEDDEDDYDDDDWGFGGGREYRG